MTVNTPSDVEIDILCKSEMLAIDIETKDPGLKEKGPGTHRGEGYICGVSAGAIKNFKPLAFYFPLKHPDTTARERERNEKIVTALVQADNEKVGTNIIYDLEWLSYEGFRPSMIKLNDILYAEPLLDEYRYSYSLNSLAQKYLLKSKKTNVLEDYHITMGWKGKAIENI